MKKILWASAHMPTEEQINDFKNNEVIYLKDDFNALQEALNNTPCDTEKLKHLACDLISYCRFNAIDFIVQPAGSPAMQFVLGSELKHLKTFDINHQLPKVMYAHSERISHDELQKDGSIKKISFFKHLGWIEV